MLEKVIYAGLAIAALTAAPGCSTADKQPEELTRKLDTFYTSRTVLDEQIGSGFREQVVDYKYKSGIEAQVTYKKGPEDIIWIRIDIDADPRNVLVRNTPAKRTPANASYQIFIDGDKAPKKAIAFKTNGSRVRIILE